jgi:hypothetical protein
MNENPSKVSFLAVLIYQEGDSDHQRRCEEPRVYSASHPEIAYQMAWADGKEQRYGRNFLGLSHLEEATDDIVAIATSQKGDAKELLIDKEQLAAFNDPRWKDVPWSEKELEEALRGPPVLFEIGGLAAIPWHRYTHAYGPASDVPTDLRRLASCDRQVREQALRQLSGSIYHQGSIFGATAVAVPFLLRIALDRRLVDRAEICQLLAEIANSSAVHPEVIRKRYARRGEKWPSLPVPSEEALQREIADVTAVRQAFLDQMEKVRQLASDEDADAARLAKNILQLAETPLNPWVSCGYCRGSGICRCKRVSSEESNECKRCNGTRKCHVCHGSGKA